MTSPATPAPAPQRTVALVTLGCARNEVDSEELAGRLLAEGFQLVADADDADAVLVNTCGFIEAAKRARQINAYYSQLGEGLLEYVGPLVDTHVQEKSLSVALREINEGLLDLSYEPLPESEAPAADPVEAFALSLAAAESAAEGAPTDTDAPAAEQD